MVQRIVTCNIKSRGIGYQKIRMSDRIVCSGGNVNYLSIGVAAFCKMLTRYKSNNLNFIVYERCAVVYLLSTARSNGKRLRRDLKSCFKIARTEIEV